MFVNEDYSNYKYLVNVSDNYVTLTNTSSVNGSWQDPQEYDVIYQFLSPSTLVIEDTKTTSSQLQFERVDVSSDFWERADSPMIFSVSVLVLFCVCFICNIFTRIVKRGGIFG